MLKFRMAKFMFGVISQMYSEKLQYQATNVYN